jgi:hypothetical protein
MTPPPTSAAVLARLRFIDLVLDHYGTLNRAIIMDYFGISQPQASLDIRAYLDQAPHNIDYDSSLKLYRRTPLYVRKFP